MATAKQDFSLKFPRSSEVSVASDHELKPKKHVIVYDAAEKTVLVQQIKDLNVKDLDIHDPRLLHLPSRGGQVTIFMDPRNQSRPTMKSMEKGRGNVMLTNLYLDRLEKRYRLQRWLGRLPLLYVANVDSALSNTQVV